jgi:hypothetical protein
MNSFFNFSKVMVYFVAMTAQRQDYIPRSISMFHDWAVNFVALVTENATDWSLDADKVALLIGKHALYLPAYEKCLDPNAGPLDRKDRDILERDEKKFVRAFVKSDIKHNSKISVVQMKAMGVTVDDETRTPAEEIKVHPMVLSHSNKELSRLTVESAPEGSTHGALYIGAKGIESRLTIPFADGTAKSYGEFHTKARFTMRPPMDFRNIDATLELRYTNANTLEAPWSDPVTVHIL